MESIIINGGRKLVGEIDLQGSKNSSLPILAATVLVNGISVIHNCPQLSDVSAAIKILEHLGCKVKREKNTVCVDSSVISCYNIPQRLMSEMRSSIVFLGSVLGRTGKAVLSSPGGCEIGLRPIDLHLKSLKTMGVSVTDTGGEIRCEVKKGINSSVISLSFPSVGATENIILASAVSKGRTVIINGAREPEIQDLANFINSCGGRIQVRKEGTVIVDGVITTENLGVTVTASETNVGKYPATVTYNTTVAKNYNINISNGAEVADKLKALRQQAKGLTVQGGFIEYDGGERFSAVITFV